MSARRSSATVITTAMMIERVAGLILESVDESEVVVGTEEAPA